MGRFITEKDDAEKEDGEVSPGARPTNDISIEFKIKIKIWNALV